MKKRKHEFRRVKRYVFIYLVILLLGLLNLRLKAQTPAVTWTGAIDSAWSRAGNWSAGKIPTSADDVVIAAAPSFQPVVMSEASCKGIMIEKGAHVKFAGDVTLHVHGDFLNEGEVFSGRGKVRFAGSGIQKITSASPLSFYTLEMDNHSDDGVSANCKITILQSLLLKKGKLKTADTITVLNDAGDAIGYYSRASYVVGNLQRKIKSRTDERYFFPVGQEGRTSYFPASVDVFSMEGTKFITAAFRPLERYIQSHLNTRDSEMNYDYIAPEGMWTISPDREPAGGWFDLRLWISGMSGLQDNLFAILKRPAGAAPREWTASFGEMSPFGGEGRELADGYALKKYCTSFSEYAIGGTGRGIPIELLNFNATLGNGVVSLQWSTASETNNAFFTVEKSNGADFMEVAKISGSGNSSVEKNYTAVDDKPYTGISYYRLKQTDFDGNSKYSEVISVNNISAKTQMAFFPNPSEGVFKLKFFSPVPKVDLVIYSQQGTASFSKSFSSTAEVILSLKKELLPGIYYMQVSTGSEDFTIQKIVIE